MNFLRMLRLAILLSAGVASAQPPEEMPAGDVTKWLIFFDKLVDIVVTDATTCDKMATDVNALIDTSKDALVVARSARVRRKKLPSSAQEHMIDGVKKMVPGMQRCGERDNVKTAFMRLDVGRRS